MATKYTRKELETRNSKNDAVIIIDNVIYNVTEFLDDHPGGEEVLLQNSGKDASQCFHDVGHSEDAIEWRKKFVIGELVEEDKWEVIKKPNPSWIGNDDITLSGLFNVWGPPIALAIFAALLYSYLIS